MTRLGIRVFGGCAVLAIACGTGVKAQDTAPTPQQWMQEQIQAARQSERLLDAADQQRGILAQYLFLKEHYEADRGLAFRAIFGQYLSWYQTFVGDYRGAERSFSIAQPQQPDDAASPLAAPGTWHAMPALEAIAALARGHKAIFLNENHSAPLTRTLSVQLLARLRAEGFDTFASETLYDDDSAALARRGYVIDTSGFYTREPVYALMVNSALKLGYRVIAYEAESDARGDAREREQAENLARRAFADHPDARLVVNAGYAHIQKHGVYLDGASMAEHFMRISGIDPLCVEQTMLFGRLDASEDHPYWTQVMATVHPAQPIVFEDAAGKPWSLRPGAYDLSVFFPPQQLREGRPTWLDLGGLRRPYRVSAIDYCSHDVPCIIEARPSGWPHAAVPLDRLVLRQPSETRELWLEPGRYRISARARDGGALRSVNIRVQQAAPRSAAEAADRPHAPARGG
jgi:hypothetical protein